MDEEEVRQLNAAGYCIYSIKMIAFNKAMQEYKKDCPNIIKRNWDKFEKILEEDEDLKDWREWLKQDEGCGCESCRKFYKRNTDTTGENR